MNNSQIVFKSFDNLLRLLFFFVVLRLIEFRFEINLPLVRYAIILYCTLLLLKTISIPESFKTSFKGMSAFLISILLVFLVHSISLGIPDITDPAKDYFKLKQLLGEKALLFSLPLLLFIRPNPGFWKPFINYAYLLLFILIPFLFLDLAPYLTRAKSPEGLIRSTAGASGFLLLISHYFKDRKKNFILAIYLISLLFMLYHARRNMVLYFGSFFIFYYYLSFFSNAVLLRVSRWKTVLNTFFLGVIGSVIFLFSNPDFSLFFERAETGMESREGVIEDFFIDIVPFSNDFYFGRGMFGSVYSLDLGIDEYGNIGAGYREGIENGYLQLILNFGFVYVLCFVILSLMASLMGFFDSNNLLAKSCGALVLLNLVDMIGFGIPELTFRYFSVWLALPFCYSRSFRKLSDLEIKNLIFVR
jgi:hypothetical protein